MAMAKKHLDGGKVFAVSGKSRSPRYPSRVPQGSPTQKSPPKGEPRTDSHQQRLTPVRAPSQSPHGSPRTSPGLLAGHYAGCKFSEPPLPSALPLPPQHWMQPIRPQGLTFRSVPVARLATGHCDMEQQLKVLLKVQA